ncbi:MAG: SCO family protein [Paracoccaceae bacterium]
MTRIYSVGAVLAVAVALGVTGFFIMKTRSNEDRFANCSTAVAGIRNQIGGPFSLIDQTGTRVTDKSVIVEPTLVYFGYTYCPDACPIDTARNAEAIDLLQARGISSTPVLISIDPERDSPEVMADYVKYTHEKMIGLTGDAKEIKSTAGAYKVFYQKSGEGEDYLMDHSTFTYLMLPDYGFVQFFGRDASAQEVADTVACFARAM